MHAVIILVGWVNFDLMRLFGFEWHPQLETYVMLQQGFALAKMLRAASYFRTVGLRSQDRARRETSLA